MKNCKNCGSNDRIDKNGWRECQHCNTRVKLRAKFTGGDLTDLGYRFSPPNQIIKLQQLDIEKHMEDQRHNAALLVASLKRDYSFKKGIVERYTKKQA